jgi:hypothetical protein
VLAFCADAAPAAMSKLAANVSAQAFRENFMISLLFCFSDCPSSTPAEVACFIEW